MIHLFVFSRVTVLGAVPGNKKLFSSYICLNTEIYSTFEDLKFGIIFFFLN